MLKGPRRRHNSAQLFESHGMPVKKIKTIKKDPLQTTLAKMGLTHPRDLLFYLPSSLRDCRAPLSSAYLQRHASHILAGHHDVESGLNPGDGVYLKLRALSKVQANDPSSPARLVKFDATDGVNMIQVVEFGPQAVYKWANLLPGMTIHLYGAIGSHRDVLQLTKPEFVPLECRGFLIPHYKGKSGVISSEVLGSAIKLSLTRTNLMSAINDVLGRFGLDNELPLHPVITPFKSLELLFQEIHYPGSKNLFVDACNAAKRLSIASLQLEAKNLSRKPAIPRSCIDVNGDRVANLIRSIPFDLTRSQIKCINDICADLSSDYCMNRLLSGDVGTGKTLTYLIPAVEAQSMGAVVGIFCPNELLVRQIAGEIGRFFPGTAYQIILSGIKLKNEDLKGNPIFIGTTALLSSLANANVALDLLVVDEQQKMSVAQKNALLHPHTNLLEATATCIPRTSAHILFAGKSISVLHESPFDKNIQTTLSTGSEGLREIIQTVQHEVQQGRQVAILYARVFEKDPDIPDDPESSIGPKTMSIEAALPFWETLLPGRIACLHGKLDSNTKEATLASFMDHKFDVVLASTVLEIGLTIPGLSTVIVIDADRYGLSTLHQIRGRICRHGGNGSYLLYCARPPENKTLERLNLIVQYTDGFVLAERDMDLRGFGDISADSRRQHGATRSLFANIHLTPNDISEDIPLDLGVPKSTLAITVDFSKPACIGTSPAEQAASNCRVKSHARG